jgi:hypothetical protein
MKILVSLVMKINIMMMWTVETVASRGGRKKGRKNGIEVE